LSLIAMLSHDPLGELEERRHPRRDLHEPPRARGMERACAQHVAASEPGDK
jgi:hypothetical protein